MPGQLHGNPKLISNLEVLEMLKDRPQTRTSKKRYRSTPADQVAAQVQDYLQNTSPCTRIDPSKSAEILNQLQSQKKGPLLGPPSNGSPENGASSSTTSTTGFGLTLAEAIQCLNVVPTEPVEIHLVVEDLSNRLSERQQEELLEFIKSYDTQQPQQQSSPDADMTDAGEQQEEDGKPDATLSVKQEEESS